MADSRQHPPDLSFSALMNGDLYSAGIRCVRVREEHGSCGSGLAVLKIDAYPQLPELIGGHFAANLGYIYFIDLMRRMCHKMSKIAVVGEDHQPGCVYIQPADRIQIRIYRIHELDDCVLSELIEPGACVSDRLVEQYIEPLLTRVYKAAVEAYLIYFGIGLCAELADDLAVYRYSTCND